MEKEIKQYLKFSMKYAEELPILEKCLTRLSKGFEHLKSFRQTEVDFPKLESTLLEVAEKLHDNYPYFHPCYVGQMLKPPHAIARMAYFLAMHINPNNHSREGGRVSTEMEKECVRQLGSMLGWQNALGHLCSGGTVANLEALWVSKQKTKRATLAASEQAHYTHKRMSQVLSLDFCPIAVDGKGRLCCDSLESILKEKTIGTVVATAGSTLLGAVDPIADIVDLKKKYDFHLHIDGAYGGFFRLSDNLPPAVQRHFEAISQADSLAIDPHKHGLQPYGCGCILFRDPKVKQWYYHDSPYTYFVEDELHLGEISLECSRPGAVAVALWATLQMFPLKKGGELATYLNQSIQSAQNFYAQLEQSSYFETPFAPELDIVVFIPKAKDSKEASLFSNQIFEEAERQHLYLAMAKYATDRLRHLPMKMNTEMVTCLRTCFMKAEHTPYTQNIFDTLTQVAQKVMKK